jgi:hypothetical protein
MTPDREARLCAAHPHWTASHGGDPRVTCMAWGFAVGDGWYPLLDKTLAALEAVREELLEAKDEDDRALAAEVTLAQVKEKFGGLRVYLSHHHDRLARVVAHAEWASFLVCEGCGTTAAVTTEGGYVQTLCAPCRGRASEHGARAPSC